MRKEKKGCEWGSPIYRQVVKEMQKAKDDEWCHYSGMPSPSSYEQKTKRGKRSN